MPHDESGASRLLAIGAFSRRCRLPVSTLHHYHDIGLLVPAHVEARTGYRYYHPDQLDQAVRIAMLRSIGLDPARIRALVEDSSGERSQSWSDTRATLVGEVEASADRLRRFDQLMGEVLPSRHRGAVRRTELDLTWAACDTVRASSGELTSVVRRGLARLRSTVHPRARVAATFPLDLATDPIVVELHVEPQAQPETVTRSPVLATTHRGPHDQIWIGYRALLDEAERLLVTAGGHVTERYGPTRDGTPSTEILLHLDSETSC